jgi:hypothetical protein
MMTYPNIVLIFNDYFHPLCKILFDGGTNHCLGQPFGTIKRKLSATYIVWMGLLAGHACPAANPDMILHSIVTKLVNSTFTKRTPYCLHLILIVMSSNQRSVLQGLIFQTLHSSKHYYLTIKFLWTFYLFQFQGVNCNLRLNHTRDCWQWWSTSFNASII